MFFFSFLLSSFVFLEEGCGNKDRKVGISYKKQVVPLAQDKGLTLESVFWFQISPSSSTYL